MQSYNKVNKSVCAHSYCSCGHLCVEYCVCQLGADTSFSGLEAAVCCYFLCTADPLMALHFFLPIFHFSTGLKSILMKFLKASCHGRTKQVSFQAFQIVMPGADWTKPCYFTIQARDTERLTSNFLGEDQILAQLTILKRVSSTKV